MATGEFVVVALSTSEAKDFRLGREIAQAGGLVTIERTFEAPEPQPDGTTVMACVLSIQEDGSIGWRKKGTAGPFELAEKVEGFYLYAPGVRLHGDLKLPIYPVARFEKYSL